MDVSHTWSDYVRKIAGSLTQAQIAEKVGASSTSNVGRWLRGEPGMPKADNVISFARAFNRPVMEAMVAAGYFTVDEVNPQAPTPLSQYSYSELVTELLRRNPEN